MNQTVIENIVKRAKERREEQLSPVTVKTALVVQGGTLRSVASCGAAAALNYLGFTNAFDRVYGASSGAVNAAYYLAEQAALGVTVYTEDVNNRRFLDLFRRGRKMDLEFLFDTIVQDRKKHDEEKLRQHPTELKILTVDSETAETVWFSSKDPAINLYDALKASCALPVIYGRSVVVGGRKCIDGYMREPIPVFTPLQQDYTDILVLMTRHISVRLNGHVGLFSKILIEPRLRKELGKELYDLYQSRWHRYNWAVDLIQSGEYHREDGHKIRLTYICPDKEAEADRFEKKAARLANAAYSSWRNTLMSFGVTEGTDRETFDEILLKAKEEHTKQIPLNVLEGGKG